MTTQAPVLSPEWSQPAGCLLTNDIWYWQWNRWTSSHSGGHAGGAEFVEMLGGPTDLSCYPPSYTPFGHMLGTACPDGFTAACTKGGITTCCPTAHDFTCHNGKISTYAEISCSSDFQNTTAVITIAYLTDTVDGQPVETGSAGRFRLTSGYDVLFALGVAIADTAYSTTALPSSTQTATSQAPTLTDSTANDGKTSITSEASESTTSTGSIAESTTSLASAGWKKRSTILVLVAGLVVIFS